MSRIVGFYRFDDGSAVGCQACGWQGRFEELRPGIASERFDLLAFACPRCDEDAYIANAPTLRETRRAAHAGNSRAIAELAEMEALEARRTAMFATLLVDPQRLPEVEAAGPTTFIWDQEAVDGDGWTVIRVAPDGREIWREACLWEGYERFIEMRDLLRARYGPTLGALGYTDRASTWLGGDRLTAYREMGDPPVLTPNGQPAPRPGSER